MCMLNVDKYVTWAYGNTWEGQTGAAPQFLIMALFVTVSLSAGQPNVTTKTTIKKRYSEAAYYHFFKVSFWRMAQRQISLCKWDFWKQSLTWISPPTQANLEPGIHAVHSDTWCYFVATQLTERWSQCVLWRRLFWWKIGCNLLSTLVFEQLLFECYWSKVWVCEYSISN